MPAFSMLQHMSPQRRADILAGYGFRLDTLRARPGQILFQTPGIRCLEDPALMAVYAFITGALRALSVLHCQPFMLFQPTLMHQGRVMKTESRGHDRLPEEKTARTDSETCRRFALNVLVPVSDISQVGRYTGRNVARLWQRIQTVTSCWSVDDYHPANWSQAVVDSGLPASTLCRHYRFSLWIWWGLMWLTALPAIGLLLMLVTAGGSVSPTG